MRKEVRRKIDMAVRARDFGRARPPDGPSSRLLDTLDGLLGGAAAIVDAERTGRQEETAAATRRRELRRTIQGELLPHLVRVGQLASGLPGLSGKFHLRSPEATHTAFLSSSRAMLALGVGNRAAFVELGLAESLLDDLGSALDEFEATLTTSRAGRVAHVLGREQLESAAVEMGEVVEQLNRLFRYRFRKEPELLATWGTIHRIGPRERSEPEPPESGIAPAA